MPGLAAAEQGAVSLVRRVARALNREISDLVTLLFHHKPKPQPIKYRGIERLLDMLIHYNQVDLSHPDAELRLLEIFAPSEKIENINDQYWTLRAEEVSRLVLGPDRCRPTSAAASPPNGKQAGAVVQSCAMLYLHVKV
ncbi:hypothetical protein D1007_54489 [Hordeum vulgare]|nr:hypothetical protein D1007_54489 [Hordeum vulgare]